MHSNFTAEIASVRVTELIRQAERSRQATQASGRESITRRRVWHLPTFRQAQSAAQ